MTMAARDLLAVFEKLDPVEQQQVAAEILRRSVGADDLPEPAFDELAGDVFRSYEAEETGDAGKQTR